MIYFLFSGEVPRIIDERHYRTSRFPRPLQILNDKKKKTIFHKTQNKTSEKPKSSILKMHIDDRVAMFNNVQTDQN